MLFLLWMNATFIDQLCASKMLGLKAMQEQCDQVWQIFCNQIRSDALGQPILRFGTGGAVGKR